MNVLRYVSKHDDDNDDLYLSRRHPATSQLSYISSHVSRVDEKQIKTIQVLNAHA